MNIAVSTFHSAHNYGAMLQAYGLQQAMRSLGHDATFIHLHTDEIENSNRRRRPVRSVGDLGKRAAFLALRRPLKRRYQRFEHFRDTYLQVSQRYGTSRELLDNPPLFDGYVCGSDQVWNVENGVSNVRFLQFVPEGKRRIAYAPSFGTAAIPEKYHKPIADLLKKFDALSAREVSGQKIIATLTGREAELVLDPTFLVTREEWTRLATRPRINEPYIAFYSLEVGPKTSAAVARISRTLRLPVVVLGKAGHFIFRGRTFIRIDAGPSEFLGWIMDARFVITNSFHGTAFALIFEKPFLTLRHSSRSTRMENLLKLVGSENRMAVDQHGDAHEDLWRASEDERNRVAERIAVLRERSFHYLEAALSGGVPV